MKFKAVSVALAALVCAAVIAPGAGAAKAPRSPAPGACHELPTKLQALCTGPGVTCKVKADHHTRWEAVFATEPTLAKAEKWLHKAQAKHFSPVAIEHDTACSNGNGVFEVGTARFMSHSAAHALVLFARAAGFPNARSEDS